MPDHIHVIIIINETQKNQKSIYRNDDAVTSSFNDNDSLTGMVDPLYTTDLQQPSTNIGNRDKNPNNTGGDKKYAFFINIPITRVIGDNHPVIQIGRYHPCPVY
jgi:hypothetical protein